MMSSLVLLPLLFAYDVQITVHMIWFLLPFSLAAFNAVGLGLMMAPANCVNRDIEHLIRFIVRAGFFVSPVMWTWDMAVERGMGS